jgi:UDP-glucose 4-epimerase
MAHLVANECGINLNPIHMPDRPREVKHASCSADKARRLLNYETKTTLEESIRQTVDYVRSRGVKPFDYSYPLEIVTDKTPRTWSERLM